MPQEKNPKILLWALQIGSEWVIQHVARPLNSSALAFTPAHVKPKAHSRWRPRDFPGLFWDFPVLSMYVAFWIHWFTGESFTALYPHTSFFPGFSSVACHVCCLRPQEFGREKTKANFWIEPSGKLPERVKHTATILWEQVLYWPLWHHQAAPEREPMSLSGVSKNTNILLLKSSSLLRKHSLLVLSFY